MASTGKPSTTFHDIDVLEMKVSPQAHGYPHTQTEVQHAITHTDTNSPLALTMPFDPPALTCPPSGLSSPPVAHAPLRCDHFMHRNHDFA